MIKGKKISKKEFKELKNPKIIGMINHRTGKKDDKNLMIGNKYYFIKSKCRGFTTGYIETEYGEYVIKKTLSPLCIVTTVTILFVLICFVLLNNNAMLPDKSLEKENGEEISLMDNADNGNVEMISVGGHGDTIINENNKYLYLINADTNTVYFQYDILINGKVIYSTKAFEPGTMVKANIFQLLDKGEYQVTLSLKTFDLKSEAPNNGANENILITVEK